jgi:hypothetical protein
MVAMVEETVRTLAEWPQWINQVGGKPVIAFGGRPFILQPELQVKVPGIYLGENIQDGLSNLISSIQNAE